MVRIQVLAQFACLLLWLGCSAHSQPPPRPEDPRSGTTHAEHPRPEESRRSESRERDSFFDAMREFLPHKELFDLVDLAEIRQEIGLSDSDAALIKENVGKSFEALHALRRENEGKTITSDQFKQQVRDAIAPLNQNSYGILEKADFKRLLGIYVQARSYRALLNDKVANEIGLEGHALEDFRRTRGEKWQSIMEETREAMMREMRNAPPGAPPNRDTISKLFRQAEEKLDHKLAKELTSEQNAALENLKGVEFKLPAHPFNFPPSNRGRGRGGPPHGPGGKDPNGSKTESEARDRADDSKCFDGKRTR